MVPSLWQSGGPINLASDSQLKETPLKDLEGSGFDANPRNNHREQVCWPDGSISYHAMLFGIVPKQPSACRGHILRRGQLNGIGEPLDFGLASDTAQWLKTAAPAKAGLHKDQGVRLDNRICGLRPRPGYYDHPRAIVRRAVKPTVARGCESPPAVWS